MESRPVVRMPSVASSMLIGGASIVGSGALPANARQADALAMREDFFAIGADLWAAIAGAEAEAQGTEQTRLFESESI
jgi:hypothetical protein